jgi:hypothetical protein
MKLIDYYNNEFIADLAIIENRDYYYSLKSLYNGLGFFDERVKELDDERLVNFIFSVNSLLFVDQTISYYLSPCYFEFLDKYNFGVSLRENRILDHNYWFRTSEIKDRLKNKHRVRQGRYSLATIPAPDHILENLLKKIIIQKLDESGEVIVNEFRKIDKLLNFKNFFNSIVSVIAIDEDLRSYLDNRSNTREFSKIFFKSFWLDLYKKKIIDYNKFYFLNSLLEQNIEAFRKGNPIIRETTLVANRALPEDEFFSSRYRSFINRRANHLIYNL